MKNHESEEMYLETILRIGEKKPAVRSVDVVDELGYAKSSVSRAVNLLKKHGYIDFVQGGELILTAEGRKKAESVFERHKVITAALIKMGAGPATAEENACRIEHVISDELFEIVKKYAGQG